MPSSTFNKLAKAKRERFLQVAMHEFASLNYEQASVSNIVRLLGIAKGSVYQYFENKWDLYQYLVEEAHEKLLEIIHFVDARAENNLQLWFVQRVLAEIKFVHEFPEEFELLTKTRLNRSSKIASLGNRLMQKEHELITRAIMSVESIESKARDLAFITYAIKDGYLLEIQKPGRLSHDQIMDQLSSFASIIFDELD